VRRSVTSGGMKVAFLAAAVLTAAVVALHFKSVVYAAKHNPAGIQASALSLPMFFEPNQGQTAPQVKFLARGSGYGLFLTADEAVLDLQRVVAHPNTARAMPQHTLRSVIRMKLDGANSAAVVSGTEPMPGKSNYFIGNNPAKWHRDIPQFGRVQYQGVYPGIDLVYYGKQGQIEYDFRVAPGADPKQITLNFDGASTHIDSGDLVLSTPNGDIRFHAPVVYQKNGSDQKAVAGSFRQLAGNKIGFAIGNYDHSRELVIDPVLSYATYLGGSGTESLVKVAVDAAQMIYVAGSTNSTDFPLSTLPAIPPIQTQLTGQQNLFIAKINPSNYGTLNSQLIFATYLGGTGVDSLGGIAVDRNFGIYIAGTTTSTDFPTNGVIAPFQPAPQNGTHGFLSAITPTGANNYYVLNYSTYLAGNGVDTVTGIAVDTTQDAYVTGVTTSTNLPSDGFPANANGFQLSSNSPGNMQFFASKINTTFSGSASMLYSTYFGGSNPATAVAVGGGIAVDPTASNVNMYFTGTTNMLPNGLNGGLGFPLYNAQQSCLDQASTTACSGQNPTNTDGFVAKINPNANGAGAVPVYSTYIGGGGSDSAVAIAVDTAASAYVVGTTNSVDWVCHSCVLAFENEYGNGNNNAISNAYVVKIGNQTDSNFPLTYFTYLGGSNADTGQDIKVDTVSQIRVVGSTTSTNFPTVNALPQGTALNGSEDAFVASISTASGGTTGGYATYLGGSGIDEGSGVALDIFGATYAVGTTLSSNFPVTSTAYQPTLNGGSQDAFVTRISAVSQLQMTVPTSSPSPNPLAAGTQGEFTFDITNVGPDNATNVIFIATLPNIGFSVQPKAEVTGGTGLCGAVTGSTITCTIPTLQACPQLGCSPAQVEVDMTPPSTGNISQLSVSAVATANNSTTQATAQQQVTVTNFYVKAVASQPSVNAGDTAYIQVAFCPTSTTYGYNATITPSQSTSPSMVTSTSPVFAPTTVTLGGPACGNTLLSIATVARPVTTGSLPHHGPLYATWLPIGGLSLIGLGLGAGRKRRRWLAGVLFGLVAVGAILLQSGCGSASTTTTTTGGTLAGIYTITINGSASTGASQSTQVRLQVN
jgi:uncharacterized repeat protein (TIGR01451 family)